jgi:hypothetical protein
LDSKKIKIIIAAAIGLLAVIIISITLIGGSGGDEIDQAALEELRNREEPIRGGPRTAPGGDDPDIPD